MSPGIKDVVGAFVRQLAKLYEMMCIEILGIYVYLFDSWVARIVRRGLYGGYDRHVGLFHRPAEQSLGDGGSVVPQFGGYLCVQGNRDDVCLRHLVKRTTDALAEQTDECGRLDVWQTTNRRRWTRPYKS